MSRSSDLGKNERLLKDADESGARNQNDIVEYRSRSRRTETDKIHVDELSRRDSAAFVMSGNKDEVSQFIANSLKSKRGSRGLLILKDQKFRTENPEDFSLEAINLPKKSSRESINVARNYNDIGLRMSNLLVQDSCYGVACELVKDGLVISSFLYKKEDMTKDESPIFNKKKEKKKEDEVEQPQAEEQVQKAYVLHYYLPTT